MPRCGCDCKNPTVDAYYGANDWPCCDTFPDGVPCRYAAIFECATIIPYYSGSQAVACPVLELRKACFFGCEYVAATVVPAAQNCENLPSLVDVTANAFANAFPPTADSAGVWTRHAGDYRDTPATDASVTGPTCIVPATWIVDHWTLDISVALPTMTYTNAWFLGQVSRAPAVYIALDTWDEWGRNTMQLSDATAAEWPELPRRICVVALDDPGINNPCGSHAEQCTCCDPGTDEASITGNFSGCGRVSGEVTWTGTRYKSPTPLPDGVSYPAYSPCGVFWGTIGSGGDGCANGGVNWSGSVGLMTYCNGTTWLGKAYCYDTDLEEWVEQGDLTISGVECQCGGVYFDVALPELDCCCDGGVVTDCCPDGIPSTLTFAIESGCTEIDGVTATLTYDGIDSWRGETATITCPLLPDFTIEVRLYCNGTDWYIDFTGYYGFTALCTLVSCSPFEVTYLDDPGTFCGCISTIRITE